MSQLKQTTSGNRALWKLFYQQHADTPRRLEFLLQSISAQNRTTIYELVHAVKGAAETLQCEFLVEISSRICDAQEQFEVHDIALLITTLQRKFRDIEASGVVGADQNEFDTMEQLIHQHNVAARKLALKWSEQLSDSEQPDCLKRLISCLNRFDFKSASEYLRDYKSLLNKQYK